MMTFFQWQLKQFIQRIFLKYHPKEIKDNNLTKFLRISKELYEKTLLVFEEIGFTYIKTKHDFVDFISIKTCHKKGKAGIQDKIIKKRMEEIHMLSVDVSKKAIIKLLWFSTFFMTLKNWFLFVAKLPDNEQMFTEITKYIEKIN